MENNQEAYQEEYANFMEKYKRGSTDGEMVGEVISRLAQHFSTRNIQVGIRDAALNKIAIIHVNEFDDKTGKAISVAKADMLIKGSDEYAALKTEKIHLENIEQYINALKYLQKGLLTEYAHMSGN